MPTILKWRGFRFFFFSDEGKEPPHIHVQKGSCAAKFWLKDCSLAYNDDFTHNELNSIKKAIEKHKDLLLEAWNDFEKRKY